MGRIAKLLSFVRLTRNSAKITDVKVNPGGGPNITAEHFADPGDDSFPLTTDYVALNTDSGTGRETAIGYLDPLNAQKALEGEKRIYSRDAAGVEVAQVWLKNDGTVLAENDEALIEIAPDGTITITNGAALMEVQPSGEIAVNGGKITSDGDFVTDTGISLRNHTHVGNLGSPTSVPIV